MIGIWDHQNLKMDHVNVATPFRELFVIIGWYLLRSTYLPNVQSLRPADWHRLWRYERRRNM